MAEEEQLTVLEMLGIMAKTTFGDINEIIDENGEISVKDYVDIIVKNLGPAYVEMLKMIRPEIQTDEERLNYIKQGFTGMLRAGMFKPRDTEYIESKDVLRKPLTKL